MQGDSHTRAKRDTGWKRDRKARGVYWRKRADGSKSWGYYADGKVNAAPTRQGAIDLKAKAGLRKSAGLPAPNTRLTVRDYADRVLEKKRRTLGAASLSLDERAFKILLAEIGHLKPGQCGPDRLERLEADLAEGKITGTRLARRSVQRYMSVLPAVFKLAVRDGAIPMNPFALIEREKHDAPRHLFEWSRESISKLIAASETLAGRADARYNYSPLIRVLVLTGLRVSEALALRRCDVDLLAGRLVVQHSLRRDGTLGPPKTAAGVRLVPLSSGLVNLFAGVIPANAEDEDFVFHAKDNPRRALSYRNFRARGFEPALKEAGLDGKGITVHQLRHAAVSMYASAGMTTVEVAAIVGHSDPSVTAKVYSHLFDRSDVEARVRAAQASI